MKRSVLALIFILIAFLAYGQNTGSNVVNTPMDIILVLDTSSGMGSSYENVNNYITGSFLSEFLRVGDTFHLIAFSSSPRLEIARRITSIGDAETIIGRMFIQYPVESGNNITSAINFAEQYASSLPQRPKKIVIVGLGSSDANNLIGAARQRLASRNVSIDFVQVTSGQPLANLPSSNRWGTPAASQAAAPSPASAAPSTTGTAPAAQQTAAAAPSPASTAPSTTGTAPAAQQTAAAAQPTDAPATSSQTVSTSETASGTTGQTAPETSSGTSGTETIVRQDETTSPVVPETAETGISAGVGTTAAVEEEIQKPVIESGTETVKSSTIPPEEINSDSSSDGTSSLSFIIGMIVLALIILSVIAFFATRRLGSSPNRVMAEAASKKPEPKEKSVDHSRELAKYAAGQSRQRSTPYDNRPVRTENVKSTVINPSGPLLLNLFVEDQNTAIGKRNIHSLKSGYSLSVGGGQSDFLIFLVPIPSHIGEIRRDGSQCSFIPKKPKYFPELGSSELRDCINKTIRVISDKNYELRFRFEMYEDPLEALNRLLMSVNVPG